MVIGWVALGDLDSCHLLLGCPSLLGGLEGWRQVLRPQLWMLLQGCQVQPWNGSPGSYFIIRTARTPQVPSSAGCNLELPGAQQGWGVGPGSAGICFCFAGAPPTALASGSCCDVLVLKTDVTPQADLQSPDRVCLAHKGPLPLCVASQGWEQVRDSGIHANRYLHCTCRREGS